jgi:hypothetical protein
VEIPGYRDFEEIGRGSASVVYRADQEQFARTVAVKVLSVGAVEERLRRRFERECAATGRLTGHPNIVTVLDNGYTADGSPYITTAYYAHGSLGDRLGHCGPLPLDEVLTIGVVAGRLEAVHKSRSSTATSSRRTCSSPATARRPHRLRHLGHRPSQQAMTMAQSFAGAHAPRGRARSAGHRATDTYQLASTLYTLPRATPVRDGHRRRHLPDAHAHPGGRGPRSTRRRAAGGHRRPPRRHGRSPRTATPARQPSARPSSSSAAARHGPHRARVRRGRRPARVGTGSVAPTRRADHLLPNVTRHSPPRSPGGAGAPPPGGAAPARSPPGPPPPGYPRRHPARPAAPPRARPARPAPPRLPGPHPAPGYPAPPPGPGYPDRPATRPPATRAARPRAPATAPASPRSHRRPRRPPHRPGHPTRLRPAPRRPARCGPDHAAGRQGSKTRSCSSSCSCWWCWPWPSHPLLLLAR